MTPGTRHAFLALTPVALRAPFVSAKNAKSVHHVPGTKCPLCLGIDTPRPRGFRRRDFFQRLRRFGEPAGGPAAGQGPALQSLGY
jgi:hypothetical protein